MLADPVPSLVPSTEAYRIAKLNFTGRGRCDQRAHRDVHLGGGEGRHLADASPTSRSCSPAAASTSCWSTPTCATRPGRQFRPARLARVSPTCSRAPPGSPTCSPASTSAASAPLDGVGNGRAPVDGILEVVPAGRAPYDPAELLDTRAAGELLRALSGRADVVLVDAPAILPVTDAMVLASKVDAVVVVTRAGRDSRSSVVALRRALDNCPAPGLAFVFTGRRGRRPQRVRRPVPLRRATAAAAGRHGSTRSEIRATRVRSACCESRPGVLVWGPPHPAAPAAAVVGEARPLLGDVPAARLRVAARARGRGVGALPDHPQRAATPLRNLRLAARELRRRRPDVIVSDGAGVAFPFFIVGTHAGNQDRVPRGV